MLKVQLEELRLELVRLQTQSGDLYMSMEIEDSAGVISSVERSLLCRCEGCRVQGILNGLQAAVSRAKNYKTDLLARLEQPSAQTPSLDGGYGGYGQW